MSRMIIKSGEGILKSVSNRKIQNGKNVTVYLDGYKIFCKSLSNRFSEIFTQEGYTSILVVKGQAMKDKSRLPNAFEQSLELETTGDVTIFYK